MPAQRPDPDLLLDRVHAEEARAGRGKLKIFFGASAGVGKTYAMLGDARQQRQQGIDVVIGIVETHGRAETQAMADGLETLPRREVVHRNRVLSEFDLDGALARKPALILVDELAHSNVAGSRHAKRWQDIDELLAAGIDVHSTVNVQHLESLNDVVSGITGIRVWETVPDKVFDSADEVVLVDLPPDELLQRLQAGKVYLPDQAERAIRNFFRKGNLIALRELALRRTADRVDDEMLQYRREQSVSPVWQTRDLDVIQVARSDGGAQARRTAGENALRRKSALDQWPSYAKAAAACALAGMAGELLLPVVELPSLVLIFLLAIVLVSVRYGRGPAMLGAFLAVALLDFFFVPPRSSLAVGDGQYLITLAVMLGVGLIAGQLTAGSRYQAKVATRREQRVRSLYEMSRDLSAALLPEEIAGIGERFIVAEFGARAAFLLTDDNDRLRPALPSAHGLPAVDVDMGIAQWAFAHAEAAGLGTDTLAASPILYLPLKAPMRVRGILALEIEDADRLLIPEQQHLLDTFASLIAIALERVHYVAVAQETTVQMESERLRNSVLAAISHDLRTPMSVLVGLADSLLRSEPPPTAGQAEIVCSLREEALHVSGQVDNLLDMARLQSGRVEPNRRWQPLADVVISALRTLAWALAEHRIKVSLDDDLPLVDIDAVLIERVVYNLLENTVKHTPPGTCVELGANVGEKSIEVWLDDNGPGLPKGKEEAIFKKFEQGRRPGESRGFGLGLAICRAIVEAHGGEMHARNRPNGGARFMFTLPRGNPPSSADEEGTFGGPAV